MIREVGNSGATYWIKTITDTEVSATVTGIRNVITFDLNRLTGGLTITNAQPVAGTAIFKANFECRLTKPVI